MNLVSDQLLSVLLPILVATGTIFFFFFVLRLRKGKDLLVFEIGAIYVIVVSLYTLYPLFGFLANGLRFTALSDSRLFSAHPTPEEVGWVGWFHVVHLGSFVLAYLLARGRLPRLRESFTPPGSRVLIAAAIFYLADTLFFLSLKAFYGLSPTTYLESYLVYRQLPLYLAQLANHLGGIQFILQVVVLAVLFRNYAKFRLVIFGWLLSVTLITFVRLGSRTDMVLLIISAALMYQHLVRPIPFGRLVLGGAVCGVLFILLGLLRSGMQPVELAAFAYSNEFETVFANAYDLARLKGLGSVNDLPLQFYLSDLFALVPQQVMPVAKVAPSVWYVNTFYPEYAAAGGGLAFGTISESVVGGGLVDSAVRGVALGLVLATIHRSHVLGPRTFWRFVFYVWVTVLAYQLFRNTTFSLLALFVYRFLPVVLVVRLATFILARVPATPRAAHRNQVGL